MTAEGLEALRAEIAELEGPGRDDIARQIKTAREWGDLKENAEYHAAKDAQAHLETKIKSLRAREKNATIVEATTGGIVGFGSTVKVLDEASGKESTYTLVASHEASAADGKLSVDSPVAAALQGRKAGDDASFETPRGTRVLKVLDVS